VFSNRRYRGEGSSYNKMLDLWRGRKYICDMITGTLQIKERDIKRQVLDFLKLDGWYVMNNFQTLGSHPGYSDVTVLKDGRVIFMEFKKPVRTSKQSDNQVKFQKEIETHGGEYMIVRNLDDVYPLCSGLLSFA